MSYLGTAQDDNEGGGQGISNIEQGISNDEGRRTDVGDVQSMHKS